MVIHKNEIIITTENSDDVMLSALELGPKYVEALNEQISRQKALTPEPEVTDV